jgi:phosphotransferase system HPr (HPr) family protein
MSKIEIMVNHQAGLHARPAGEFVKTASKFPCEIKVRNMTEEGDFINAKSILSVLTLGVNQGFVIEIDAEGEQADEAIQALADLVENNFGE